MVFYHGSAVKSFVPTFGLGKAHHDYGRGFYLTESLELVREWEVAANPLSRDQNDEKALAWAKEHDVKFPVVKPKGGNPLGLHSRGILHLFIVKADGTLIEEGHPMRIFNEEKFKELKSK